MATQSEIHAALRSATGTELTYEGDFHALWDALAIPTGPFNGRMITWINGELSANYQDLPGAMTAYALSGRLPQLGYFLDDNGTTLADDNGSAFTGE